MSNAINPANELGNQNYLNNSINDTSEHSYNYNELTNTPMISILTQPINNYLYLNQTNDTYKRVIIVRYTGEIREVYPDEYDKFKDNIAVGVYQPIEFSWSRENDYNQEQATAVINAVSGTLSTVVREWFAKQLPEEPGAPVVTRQLSIDTDAYNSPLL